MKTTGIVMIVLGVLSIMAGLLKDHLNTIMIIWIILGAYLIHRAKQKQEEEDSKQKWLKGEQKEQNRIVQK